MIVLPAEFAASLTTQPLDEMVEAIAGLIGQPGDPDGRALAMRCLQEGADQLNAGGVLLFSRKELEVEGLTQGQVSFELPSDWGWAERESAYALGPDDKPLEKLTWQPWENYRDMGPAGESVPQYLSIRSEADGIAFMHPAIDTARVSKLRIPYIARIPQLAESNELRLSPEARHALRAWAKAYVMQSTYIDKPAIYAPFFKLAEDCTRAAWGADSRRLGAEYVAFAPDEVGRLPGTDLPVSTGRTFIEV